MSDVTRRDVLKFLAAAPLAEFAVTALDLERAATVTRQTLEELANRGQQYRPKFFSPDDWRTVRVLADIVIPRDARSGSATDAGVPEFMDFMLGDRPTMRPWMREGLSWLAVECERRFGKSFADCTPQQRVEIVEDIAWPRKAKPEMQPGVRFFNNFRNLTSSGFWSSQMGVKDLGYIGNMPQARWNGCPPPALAKLGVRYS
jgi:gluconate 2-dehydrogenase gamma chain